VHLYYGHWPAKLGLSDKSASQYHIFWPMYWIVSAVSWLPTGIGKFEVINWSWRYVPQTHGTPEPRFYATKAPVYTCITTLCLIFWPKCSILSWLPYCQIGLGNKLYWISHNVNNIICWGLSRGHEHCLYASKCYGFAINKWAEFHILTQELTNVYTVILPNWTQKYAVLGRS